MSLRGLLFLCFLIASASTAPKNDIEAWYKQFETLMNSEPKDRKATVDKIASMAMDDVIVYRKSPLHPIRGKESLRRIYETQHNFKIHFKVVDVDGTEDLAMARGDWSVKGTKGGTVNGNFLGWFHKVDGEWLMKYGMYVDFVKNEAN